MRTKTRAEYRIICLPLDVCRVAKFFPLKITVLPPRIENKPDRPMLVSPRRSNVLQVPPVLFVWMFELSVLSRAFPEHERQLRMFSTANSSNWNPTSCAEKNPLFEWRQSPIARIESKQENSFPGRKNTSRDLPPRSNSEASRSMNSSNSNQGLSPKLGELKLLKSLFLDAKTEIWGMLERQICSGLCPGVR